MKKIKEYFSSNPRMVAYLHIGLFILGLLAVTNYLYYHFLMWDTASNLSFVSIFVIFMLDKILDGLAKG
jgi:hypothetical protein